MARPEYSWEKIAAFSMEIPSQIQTDTDGSIFPSAEHPPCPGKPGDSLPTGLINLNWNLFPVVSQKNLS